MEKNHKQWLKSVTRGDSNREIARRAGLTPSTISRQLEAGALRPDVIIDIAQAYGESPVYALVDLGYIESRWINEPGIATALSRATDEDLTSELLRRLHLLPDMPIDELAARRQSATPGNDPHVQPAPYAADSSDTEPEPGDDNYHDGP